MPKSKSSTISTITPFLLTPNTSPDTSTSRIKIALSSVDNTTGHPIIEDYSVSGPTGRNLLVIDLPVGNKAVVALSNSTVNGSPFLKIYYPTAGSDLFYITYAIADNTYQDGYQDLTGTIPATFIAALKNWINMGSALPINPITIMRILTFSFYGTTTNQVASSTNFTVNFSGLFSATVVPAGGGEIGRA